MTWMKVEGNVSIGEDDKAVSFWFNNKGIVSTDYLRTIPHGGPADAVGYLDLTLDENVYWTAGQVVHSDTTI